LWYIIFIYLALFRLILLIVFSCRYLDVPCYYVHHIAVSYLIPFALACALACPLAFVINTVFYFSPLLSKNSEMSDNLRNEC
jgi:hypothetical protein